MSLRSKMVEELINQIDELHKLPVGSDEYNAAINGVTKLANAINEMDKVEAEKEVKYITLEQERELKLTQMKAEKKNNNISHGIAIGTFIGGAALTVFGTIITLGFDMDRNVTSTLGRQWLNKLVPKK